MIVIKVNITCTWLTTHLEALINSYNNNNNDSNNNNNNNNNNNDNNNNEDVVQGGLTVNSQSLINLWPLENKIQTY